MLPLLLTLVHEHGQEISRLPRPSDVHCAHIRKSDDSDNACAKIGRKVTQQGQRARPTISAPPPVPAPPRPPAASTSSPSTGTWRPLLRVRCAPARAGRSCHTACRGGD